MPHCTRCGSPVTATARFCASCGTIVEAVPAMAPAQAATPPGAAGPVGRVQSPALVLVLTLVTLGIYWLVWGWRIARESDAFTGAKGRASTPVRSGVLIVAIGLAILLPAYAAIFAGVFEAFPPDVVDGTREPTEAELEAAAATVVPWFAALFLSWLVILGGYIAFLVGSWRVWRMIEADERARGVPSVLSPGLMLVLVIVPYVNVVGIWIAMYRVQKGLNGVWTAARGAPSVPA